MKVRNGFVSNSSSSSFVLAYNKQSVITDPELIVKYIEEHPRREVMFISDCLFEGQDVFYLSLDQKNYLLNHKKRFIDYNREPMTITDYSVDPDENGKYPLKTVPHVTAITETYKFNYNTNEYVNPEVDMSDIPEVNVSVDDYQQVREGTASEEVQARVKANRDRLELQWKRERAAKKVIEDKYLDEVRQAVLHYGSINNDTLEVTYVNVDRNSCSEECWCESEFAPRYFGLSENSFVRFVKECDGDEEEEE